MKASDFFKGVSHLWWIPLITGIVSIGLGIWCLWSPTSSLPVLAYIFASCFCGAGILNLILSGIGMRVHIGWGWTMALGLLEIICGLWMFFLPVAQLTVVFMLIIGIWILVAAVNAVCESFAMASFSSGWFLWSIVLLIATIFFAIVFLSNPIAGGVAVWIWLGISLITFGAYRLSFASRMKNSIL